MFKRSGLKSVRKAQWEAIVSLEDVCQVRTIFSGAIVPGSWKTPKHLVTGIGECVCGKTLVVSRNAGEVVYRCIKQVTAGAGNGAGHMTIRSSLVDNQVGEAVLTRYLVHPDRTATADVEAGKLADLHAERSEVQDQQSLVTEIYLDKLISDTEFRKQKTVLNAREEQLVQDIEAISAHQHTP